MDTRSRTVPPVDPVVPGKPLASNTDNAFRALDRAKEASVARVTGGVSPAALTLAFSDWLIHLASAPGKRLELASLALQNAGRVGEYNSHTVMGNYAAPLAEPLPGDRRFSADVWQAEPFRLWQQAFLLTEQWWGAATRDVPGTTAHHERVVSFTARQLLDMAAPTNSPFTNPEVVQRTAATFGANLVQGAWNAIEDAERQANGQPAVGIDQFKVGVDVAVTPGKVVFRNHLIELIQYC